MNSNKNGFMVISGADEGIMEAANCGAGADNSFGLNIKLPHEQQANSYIRDSTHWPIPPKTDPFAMLGFGSKTC
jgi:predicted Rossmann-fold nucleotide-binding protein